MAIARRQRGGGDADPTGRGTLHSCQGATEWPALWEFLSASAFLDGSARKPGTALVTFSDGRWRVWLHDVHDQQSAWVSAESLWAALAAADAAVCDAATEWRADKARTGNKR